MVLESKLDDTLLPAEEALLLFLSRKQNFVVLFSSLLAEFNKENIPFLSLPSSSPTLDCMKNASGEISSGLTDDDRVALERCE